MDKEKRIICPSEKYNHECCFAENYFNHTAILFHAMPKVKRIFFSESAMKGNMQRGEEFHFFLL